MLRVRLCEDTTSDGGTYIGGKLSTFESQWEDRYGSDEYEDARFERAQRINSYIIDYSDYYIEYCPDHIYYLWSDPSSDELDLWERMAIKEGVDLIAYPDYLKAIGYYGYREDVYYLYPISKSEFDDIRTRLEELEELEYNDELSSRECEEQKEEVFAQYSTNKPVYDIDDSDLVSDESNEEESETLVNETPNTTWNFEDVDGQYTGGGISIFYGKLQDGTYFIGDDSNYDVTLVDSDPSAPHPTGDFMMAGDDMDWLEEHLVRYLDTEKESPDFWLALGEFCKDDPDFRWYSFDDLAHEVKQLKRQKGWR